MSIAYPCALDTLIYHSVAFPRGGVVEVDNSSQFYVYVAIGYKSSIADVLSQNVGLVPPYGRRAFNVNLTTQSLAVTIAPTNVPFAYRGTIRNSQAQIRITEYRDPKAYLNSPTFDIVAADQVIIAGGLIEANQSGMYTRDQAGNEVFAMNLEDGTAWAGQVLDDGDVMIGRGGQYILWDNSAGTVSIVGGGTVRAVSSSLTFGTSGEVINYSSGSIRLSNGNTLTITGGSYNPPGTGSVIYLTCDPDVATSQPLEPFYWDDIPADWIIVAVVVANGTAAPSVFVTLGGSQISGGQIITGSIVTGNLSATAIDGMLITGATIRTNAAAVPDVQMDSNGLSILADASDHIEWKDSTGDRVSSAAGQYSETGTTFNRLKIYVNELLNRERGVIDFIAASGSGVSGGLSVDLGGSSDRVEIRHIRTGANNGIAFRLLNMIAELCDYGGSSLIGFVIGAPSGTTPGATLDVRGDVSATAGGTFQKLTAGSIPAVNVGDVSAEDVFSNVYHDQDGHAGISSSVTLAALTPGGTQGSLSFSGGILVARVNPT